MDWSLFTGKIHLHRLSKNLLIDYVAIPFEIHLFDYECVVIIMQDFDLE